MQVCQFFVCYFLSIFKGHPEKHSAVQNIQYLKFIFFVAIHEYRIHRPNWIQTRIRNTAYAEDSRLMGRVADPYSFDTGPDPAF